MASWKRQGLFSLKSTGSTSNRSTRNSHHGRCGACRMRLPAHSRNSTPFPNSRRPRNWGLSCLNCLRSPTVSPFPTVRSSRRGDVPPARGVRTTFWPSPVGRSLTVLVAKGKPLLGTELPSTCGLGVLLDQVPPDLRINENHDPQRKLEICEEIFDFGLDVFHHLATNIRIRRFPAQGDEVDVLRLRREGLAEKL